MTEESDECTAVLTPRTSLPPILEDSETSEACSVNGTTEESAHQPKVNGDGMTNGAVDPVVVLQKERGKPVTMDEERKKQVELELQKFVQSRLIVEQRRQQAVGEESKKMEQVKVVEPAAVEIKKGDDEEDYTMEDKNVSENEPIVRTDVVREADTDDKDEYPEQGLAKNLLSKFQTLAAEASVTKKKEHRPSAIATKSTGTLRVRVEGGADASHFVDAEDDMDAPGGVFESQPIVRTDVIKEDDRKDDEELPPAGFTKNLLSSFREMEKSGDNTPVKVRSRAGSGSGSVLNDFVLKLDKNSGGVSENEPITRENVVRESDSLDEKEELPSRGMAKGLLKMFSKVSEEAKKESETLHKPSGVAKKRWSSKIKKTVEVKEETPKAEPVKEGVDEVHEEELPKSGQAKGLLTKFKTMETTEEGSVYKLAWSAGDVSKSASKAEDRQTEDKQTKVKATKEEEKVVEKTEEKIEKPTEGVNVAEEKQISTEKDESVKKEEPKTIQKTTTTRPAGKLSAMYKFKEMEAGKSETTEYKPVKVAGKSLGEESKQTW